MKKTASPIGTTLSAARRKRTADSAEYRRERKRLEPYEKLARAVIQLRMRQNLTQEQLAGRIGTTASAISRLESGQHMPSMETLRKLAHASGGHLLVGFEVPGEAAKDRELIAI
jgi:ribosome-binding protein aMBF1 (putative translation factor)